MGYLYMLESSIMVENLEEAVQTFGSRLGIWPPNDMRIASLWEQPEVGAKPAFCPIADLALAPTRINLIQPIDPDQWIGIDWKRQAPCPSRYHCLGIIVDDLDFLIRHFDRLGIPYYIATEVLNIHELQQVRGRRLFVGRPKDNPRKYDPAYDLNTAMEILSVHETTIWALPQNPVPPVSSLRPGAFVRIEAWSLLVDDIYKAIMQLGKNFFLWPAPGNLVQDIPEEGIKSIQIPMGVIPESARLELISPYDLNKPAGKWFKQWGQRLYHLRILVNGLDTRLRDLEARGVPFDVRQPGETLKYRRAWLDPKYTLGRDIELVDYDAYTRSGVSG